MATTSVYDLIKKYGLSGKNFTIKNGKIVAVKATDSKSDKGTKANKTFNSDGAIVSFAGSWGSFKFYVKSSKIIGIKDLSITVSQETETKSTNSKENYVSIKNKNPAEITLTAIFSRLLGVSDVRSSSWKLMNIIRKGRKGYFYCGNDKLLPPMLVGTNAKTTKVEIGPDGKWWYCEVQITLKQCEKYDGGTSGTISSSTKASTKSSSKKSSSKKSSSKKSSSSSGTKKSSIYDLSPERKKQIEQAKQKAKQTAKGAAKASIQKKLSKAGKTSTGGGTGRRVAAIK